MAVLVTGGIGYIGSHTTIELIEAGREVVIVDDLSNSNIIVLDRIEELTGKRPKFYELKVQDRENLEVVFKENDIKEEVNITDHITIKYTLPKDSKLGGELTEIFRIIETDKGLSLKLIRAVND
jgi:UDP-glucose 4-epimerase